MFSEVGKNDKSHVLWTGKVGGPNSGTYLDHPPLFAGLGVWEGVNLRAEVHKILYMSRKNWSTH